MINYWCHRFIWVGNVAGLSQTFWNLPCANMAYPLVAFKNLARNNLFRGRAPFQGSSLASPGAL